MKKLFLLFVLLGCSQEVNNNKTAPAIGFNFNDVGGSVYKDTSDLSDTISIEEDIQEVLEEDILKQEDVEDKNDIEDSEDIIIGEDLEELPCIDEDGDGFGDGCNLGPDCDDLNPNFGDVCPDCSKPGTVGCLCSGKSLSCYSYDPVTLGKGVCKKGQQLCKNGYWDYCIGDIGPSLEICDGKDNNCDGQTDEGVKSTCGNCDLTCNQQVIGGPQNPWVLNSENSTGLGLDPQGNVVLDMTKISLNLKFIWIANSPNNTVSKIDCKQMIEVGRYTVCSDPSRTSVDLDGNVWVGCRGDGKVAKIIADKKNCIDKNGNGIIETSTNSQVVPNDECIKFIVQPEGSTIARGAAVDKYNHVWIGFWNTSNIRRLEPDNGNVVDTINIGCNPYGLVIDQKGFLWAQGAGCGHLIMVNTETKQIVKYKYPSGAYGLNVDNKGRIWVASGNSASVFEPKTGQWQVVNMQWGGGRGLATSNNGYVYVAVDGAGGAVKINGNTDPPTVEGFIKGAGNPVGAAIDYDGFVWVVNQGGSNATKMDPKTMTAIGSVPVGSSPYTYSDMTGYTLNYFTAPKGQYSTVFFGGISANPITIGKTKQVWQNISAEADLPEGTSLQLRLRAADNKFDLEAAQWSAPIIFPPEQFPYDLINKNIIGNLLQVEIQLLTKDKKTSPVLKSITAKSKLI